MYATLLIDLFKFLAPFLRNAELTKPAQLLYKVSRYLRRTINMSLSEVRVCGVTLPRHSKGRCSRGLQHLKKCLQATAETEH